MEMVGAFVLPILLIPFLARVTYNRLVSIALTVIVMVVMFQNFSSIWTIVLAVIGLLIGSYLSMQIGKKVNKKWS
ncbi:CsbA family protein [Pseudalkalibacillus decolorationis]|uniref:CsbA family protein n=1 Tax=Pseudalkalibacillus decolorationis TaxID=163879 RepID=UPI0021472716|nr:CsbA family protein [Pseudalkalibacillus decolorationis]